MGALARSTEIQSNDGVRGEVMTKSKKNKEDEDFHKLVRRAAVLPLVPEHLVEDVWFQTLNDNESDGQAVLRFN